MYASTNGARLYRLVDPEWGTGHEPAWYSTWIWILTRVAQSEGFAQPELREAGDGRILDARTGKTVLEPVQ
jgi:hypothetical protein